MKYSCKYCGGIHDKGYVCPMKPKKQESKRDKMIDHFRWSKLWRAKRYDICITRDLGLCQICIRGLYLFGDMAMINYDNIQVHHVVPLEEDYTKRLDDDNLLSCCPFHHRMCEDGEISRQEQVNIIHEQNEKKGIN